MQIYFFLLFGPLLLSKLLTFSFRVHFKQFKVLYEHHLQFYKSSLNCNSNRATYKEFLRCLRIGFVVFCGLFFSVLDPLYLWGQEGGRNFLICNPFLKKFSASDTLRGGVQVLFGYQKQHSPPIESGLPWALKCSLTGCSTLLHVNIWSVFPNREGLHDSVYKINTSVERLIQLANWFNRMEQMLRSAVSTNCWFKVLQCKAYIARHHRQLWTNGHCQSLATVGNKINFGRIVFSKVLSL